MHGRRLTRSRGNPEVIEFNEQDHSYHSQGVRYPSVTNILAAEGFYGDAAAYFTEYSRDRGRFVHKIIQYHIEGVLDESTIDPVLRPYYDAWLSFERDTGFVSERCEMPIASDLYKVAGTPDHVGRLNECFAIVDVKTGVMNPVTGVQLAAYELLLNVSSAKRFGLQLKDSGKYSLKEYKDRTDRGIFLAALSIYQWKKNNNIRRG